MARTAGPGRPRKSIEEHILNGTYRKDRHGPIEPADLPAPFPSKPKSLPVSAGAVWDRLAAVLNGVAKARDVPTLEDLCRWIDRAERINVVLSAMDPAETGYVKALTGAAIATDKILQLSARFGISPADRAKLRSDTSSGPPKPKVKVRTPTKSDRTGPPKTVPKSRPR